jgi:predicted RNA-binding Zn-ribbon protein involved in translation (DUF1610 family)
MECPICGAIARALRATTFAGRKINCPSCGDYDVSRVVLENHILQSLDRAKRLEVLEQARRAASPTSRPIITSYFL